MRRALALLVGVRHADHVSIESYPGGAANGCAACTNAAWDVYEEGSVEVLQPQPGPQVPSGTEVQPEQVPTPAPEPGDSSTYRRRAQQRFRTATYSRSPR
ncbi:MAG: hypothetical protein D6753_01675 [Planctomycetota bacterium]|nr:MAG: hypothetical protein D6753_01675 [Planctomycetota bacterium]